ncbi:MAG: hypothetical protein ACO3JL_10700, partial [Myxococcota bacterium]
IYVRGVDKSSDGGMCGRCPRRPPPPDDQPDIPIDSSTPHAAATTTYRPRDGTTVPLGTTTGSFVRYSVEVDQTTGAIALYEDGTLLYEGEVSVSGNLANVVSLSAVAYRWQHAGTCWRDLNVETCQ